MIFKVGRADKAKVVELLRLSFKDNLSVHFLVGSRPGREQRLRRLMSYAFDMCLSYGEVWMTAQQDACALVLYPHQKCFSLYASWLDLRLAFGVIGLSKVGAVLRREKRIAAMHPEGPFCYLWFIGVNPWVQRRGLGSMLLSEIAADAANAGLPVYLETSALQNVSWYQQRGFSLFHEQDFGYKLYFLKREAKG